MTVSRDLFLSILALDSYNRGYNSGVAGLSDNVGTQIGNASIVDKKGDQAAQATGFYATAYSLGGETIISYRGTDNFGATTNPVSGASDVLRGWTISLGWRPGTQINAALEFYKDVTGSTSVYDRNANVTLTGHSLGGGLAGMVAALSGSKGVGFDYMPFGVAAWLQYGIDSLTR
jgi:Lipase (class 3)